MLNFFGKSVEFVWIIFQKYTTFVPNFNLKFATNIKKKIRRIRIKNRKAMQAQQLKRLVRKIDRFNKDLSEYFKTTGEKELPSVDSTYISLDPVDLYKYEVLKTKLKVTDCDGDSFDVANDYQAYELEEGLRYDKRRLAKAWRIWKSENPDAELEKDDEQEDD